MSDDVFSKRQQNKLYIKKLKDGYIRIGIKGFMNGTQYGLAVDLPLIQVQVMLHEAEKMDIDEVLLNADR